MPGGYGAPPGGYGAPPGGYGAPPGGYGAPPGGYGAPPGGYGPLPGGYGAPREHEFSEGVNAVMQKAAFWSKGLAIVGFVTGALSFLQGNVVATAVQVSVGYFLFEAGRRFELVATTEGRDIHHTMDAIRKVGDAFTVKLIVLAIALGIVACGVIGFLVLFAVGGATR